ncbi:MAG TPA: NAD(+)/NADH kinase [Gaiellaceae bacterium]|jgi:NAD+ kinase
MPQSEPISTAAVITHGRVETIGDGLERLHAVSEHNDVKLLFPKEEREKHGLPPADDDVMKADLVIVLGGDGTMLRTLDRFMDSGIPVFGVNYGRVGFLTSCSAAELEDGVERAFTGDYRVLELPTLEVEANGKRRSAINDIVLISSTHGRVVELNWQVDGEDYGNVACDGMVCSTAIGSTAYNLSNGGPVLVWGIDVISITFVAPHTLAARPLVIPRGQSLLAENVTADIPLSVLVDGYPLTQLACGERAKVTFGAKRGLLALLPEVTFVRRFREIFPS